jgi:hypothetical protein
MPFLWIIFLAGKVAKKGGGRWHCTVNGGFANNLHDADDAGLFAIAVIKECQISLPHRMEVVPRAIVPD